MRFSSTCAAFAVTMLVVAGGTGNAVALSLFQSELQAQQFCPNDNVVWLDFKKRIYYRPGQKQYASGRTGLFVCQAEAKRDGYRRSIFGLR
jgi:hypothetical protein